MPFWSTISRIIPYFREIPKNQGIRRCCFLCEVVTFLCSSRFLVVVHVAQVLHCFLLIFHPSPSLASRLFISHLGSEFGEKRAECSDRNYTLLFLKPSTRLEFPDIFRKKPRHCASLVYCAAGRESRSRLRSPPSLAFFARRRSLVPSPSLDQGLETLISLRPQRATPEPNGYGFASSLRSLCFFYLSYARFVFIDLQGKRGLRF